ncbi:polysaccharide deacetylase family protein [Galactobacter caseinivorans]|uniref:polysaccharide deacetylase family protein n=1 Tax=Galactobacter caseinivorans TaxID=2676123 RepID=UPI001F3933AB|nr:polysaccharide deacetylase family protein [Galactobacter caseinivorans]
MQFSFNRRSLRVLPAILAAGALALAGCTASGDQNSSSAQPNGSASAQGSGTAPAPSGSGSAGSSDGAKPSDGTTPASDEATKVVSTPLDKKVKTKVWADNSMVPHLFFHSLVVNPKVAFKDPESGRGYLDYMVTVGEFKKVLQQVYDNDYVLVSPHALASVDSKGNMKPTKLNVPVGKKPMVLSIDDVSYYEYMKGDGFPTKLVVTEDGSVKNEYTDPETKKTTVGDYDVMPIVDEFVKKHPDFAPYGHKGVLALTGYNGVLGYRSSPSIYKGKNKNLDADIAEATKVADKLKSTGWEFSSHAWGHINFTKSSLSQIKADTSKWKSDVEPIVGKTDLLIYPFGADISGLPKYSGAKYDYLKKQGYNFYFNVDGSTPAWGQWGKGYLREARINIDGISLKAAVDGRKVLSNFFDPKSVIDPARPKSISGK